MEVNKKLASKRKKFKKAMSEALLTMGGDFVIQSKKMISPSGDMTAYDTGKLHDSIEINEKKELYVTVHANTDYASFVHNGTSKMSPRPFFTITLKNNEKIYRDILIHAYNKM